MLEGMAGRAGRPSPATSLLLGSRPDSTRRVPFVCGSARTCRIDFAPLPRGRGVTFLRRVVMLDGRGRELPTAEVERLLGRRGAGVLLAWIAHDLKLDRRLKANPPTEDTNPPAPP
jgi:hypothetical protein